MATQINTEDEYTHIKDQLYRQTIERDALNETLTDLTQAVQLWESEHPPEPEPEQPIE